jgi:outer membrane protein OmpA-like peptidoglycan-associated protein
MSVGLRLGTTSPFTDVRSHTYYRTISNNGKSEYKPYVGVNFLYMFSHVLGVNVDANIGSLQGLIPNWTKNRNTTERYMYERLGFSRAIYFNTKIKEGSVNLYINLTNLSWFTNYANNKNAKPRKWGVYSYVGVGYVKYNPLVQSLYEKGNDVIEKELAYMHGFAYYRNKTGFFQGVGDAMFPVALGFKYNVSSKIDIGVEGSMRFVTSDKLDGVVDLGAQGNKYTKATYLPSTPYAAYANDKYALLGVTVSYKVGSNNIANNPIEWNDPAATILKNTDAEMTKLRALLNDSDKDGVSDAFDKEPNTPAGAKIDGSGQALDVDGDGVADYKDEELFSPKGSSVNESGVAADADGDGVPDVRDMEPASKANALVNFRGISIGQRQDSSKSSSATNSKPVFIFPSIYFDLNSAEIKPSFHTILSDIAKTMVRYPYIKVNVYGNSDQRGNDAFNIALGKRRAEAVSNYLKTNYKIDPIRVNAVESYGRARPISDKHEPNRRVDIVYAEQ